MGSALLLNIHQPHTRKLKRCLWCLQCSIAGQSRALQTLARSLGSLHTLLLCVCMYALWFPRWFGSGGPPAFWHQRQTQEATGSIFVGVRYGRFFWQINRPFWPVCGLRRATASFLHSPTPPIKKPTDFKHTASRLYSLSPQSPVVVDVASHSDFYLQFSWVHNLSQEVDRIEGNRWSIWPIYKCRSK